MSRLAKFTSCLFLIFAIVCFSGCIERFVGTETDIRSVKPITPEEIESIFAELSHEITEKYPSETNADGDPVVFWLEGGSVWHSSRACGSVERADPEKVFLGSVIDAREAGKERACKICSVGEDTSLSESDVSATVSDTSEGSACDEDQPTDQDLTVIPNDETEKYPNEYNDKGELLVFWLEGGEVWHLSRECSSLSRSDPDKIQCGTEPDALASGKSRACKKCS